MAASLAASRRCTSADANRPVFAAVTDLVGAALESAEYHDNLGGASNRLRRQRHRKRFGRSDRRAHGVADGACCARCSHLVTMLQRRVTAACGGLLLGFGVLSSVRAAN